MATALWIISLFLLGGLGIIIFYLRKLQQPKPELGAPNLLLDIIENLRKEVAESGGKNRVEMQERLDKITSQISQHQQTTTENLQKQFFESRQIIAEVAEKLTVNLQWQRGDVALVDNFVAMHGRRSFEGSRKVLASLVA